VTIPPATGRVERVAAASAVAVAVLLTGAKVVAWQLTGSTVVLSDALEGLVNVVSSLIALWAIHQSHRPADRTHPYGHGRFELLSAAIEGGMITIAAVVIVWRAIEALLSKDIHLEALDLGIVLLLGTVVINGIVGSWLLVLGRRHGSPALRADGKHLWADAMTTGGAIAALVIVRLTGWNWVDPVAAITIGLCVGIMGLRVVRTALGDLVDEQDQRDFERISAVLDRHCGRDGAGPTICSWHKLRVRHVGREHWVEFHMSVPGGMDVQRAHDDASVIEDEISALLGPGNATAHIEPCRDSGCERCRADRGGS